MFTIVVQNIAEDSGKTEPYLVKSKGSVLQYLDWDNGDVYKRQPQAYMQELNFQEEFPI